MMKTYEVKAYQFDELSDEAKDKAREWYRNATTEYAWADEALDSINALAAHFGGKMKDWSIDWFDNSPSYASFDMPDMEETEIETKLAELGTFNPETLRGHGDCTLTGYTSDDDAIDGFRKSWHKGNRDLVHLMEDAFESWIDAAHKDAAWQLSNEQVDESILANQYEFTQDGKRFVTRNLSAS